MVWLPLYLALFNNTVASATKREIPMSAMIAVVNVKHLSIFVLRFHHVGGLKQNIYIILGLTLNEEVVM